MIIIMFPIAQILNKQMLLRLNILSRMCKVYAKGLNISGQIDNTYQNHKKFVHIAQLDNYTVRDIGCGYLQTYYLLSDGQLLKRGHTLDTLTSIRMLNFYRIMPSVFHLLQFFSFIGKKAGVPFHSHQFTILNLDLINQKVSIKKAIFGLSGVHLVDDQGNMYVTGQNYFGQRATGDKLTIEMKMRKIPGIQIPLHESKQMRESKVKQMKEYNKISDVALGLQHTILITEQGEAYGCGKADAYQVQPFKYHYYKQLTTFPQIETPELVFNKRRVTKAACGYKHTILLTEDGKIYALGSNKYGQCGLDSIKYQQANKITQVYFPYLQGQKIVDIKCGSNHTLILTNFHLYYMGINQKYQNPFLTYKQNIFAPTILNLPARPIKIFTNFDRIAVICDDQKAYIFGGNSLAKRGGQSGELQVIQEFKFNENSLIGLGFSHTVIKP